jgi:hypothetical protein
MKNHYDKFFTILLVLISLNSMAKVDPPNYDFHLKQFETMLPGQSKASIEQQFGAGEFVFQNNGLMTYRFYVQALRYRFPVLVQFQGDVVRDFHASLPVYFLHDIFHKSLIDKFGMQDTYFNYDEQSIYIWNKLEKISVVYASACTITCFPLFLAIIPAKTNQDDSSKSVLEILKSQTFLMKPIGR